MQRSKPFSRVMSFMSALAAIMAMNTTQQQIGLAQLGTYESRGKGKTRIHNRGGTKAHARAAAKARNVRRNRLAHR